MMEAPLIIKILHLDSIFDFSQLGPPTKSPATKDCLRILFNLFLQFFYLSFGIFITLIS